MKYLCLLVLLAFMTGTAIAQELPRLSVSGNHLQTADGKAVTLRGVSLCSLEWHNPLALLEKASGPDSDWKANVIRLPVQDKEWRKSDPLKYMMTRLDPAVKACRKNNVYCIIDWHAIGPWNDARVQSELKGFWDHAAPRYAAEKHILYEIFNEPTTPKQKTKENWLAWRAQAQKWVDDISRKAPNTVLLVGSPHWSQMPSFAVADPLRGKNIVYTAHVYPNYKTGQWDTLFGKAADTIPLFITEWGWTEDKKAWDGIRGTEKDYAQPLKNYLDEKPHVNWTAWSFDPKCGPAMLGGDVEMGEFVQSWLKDYDTP